MVTRSLVFTFFPVQETYWYQAWFLQHGFLEIGNWNLTIIHFTLYKSSCEVLTAVLKLTCFSKFHICCLAYTVALPCQGVYITALGSQYGGIHFLTRALVLLPPALLSLAAFALWSCEDVFTTHPTQLSTLYFEEYLCVLQCSSFSCAIHKLLCTAVLL